MASPGHIIDPQGRLMVDSRLFPAFVRANGAPRNLTMREQARNLDCPPSILKPPFPSPPPSPSPPPPDDDRAAAFAACKVKENARRKASRARKREREQSVNRAGQAGPG
ncbi:MAG: hypothetical protein FRX48_06174 [Lasallia pustulata]|uniref:Uncharacterized protein n=1 Tax=Lasallia pustulata TaxID=136370 RepID=A0A5M8PJF9_9LECA|nr:MAG: hypothetical protein FRX48_06174 [Lasallia pustulata]